MSEHEPIDPELASLFRDAPVPAPSDEVRQRIASRLDTSIVALGAAHAGGAHLASKGIALASTKGMACLGAAFVVGAIAGGAAVHSTMRGAPSPAPVPLASASAPASASASAPASASASASASVSASAVPSAASASSRDNAAVPDALVAERTLLDDARARLASGDPAAALTRLADHARRFPHGRLGEEREALAIEALVQSGRYGEARDRAAAFRRRAPTSVFLPAIDATLDSIP